MRAVVPSGSGRFAGKVATYLIIPTHGPTSFRRIETIDGFDRANENGLTTVDRPSDNVGALIDSGSQINDTDAAGVACEHRVVGCLSGVGAASRLRSL